jgi:polysaccharide deacetylase 2 family uncharacterized protein YibQ
MNNFKNFVILCLSIIVLIQAVLLISLSSQRRTKTAVSKSAQAARVPARAVEKAPAPPVTRPVVAGTPAEARKPSVVLGKTRYSGVDDGPPILGRIALVLDDWGYNLKNRAFITDNDFHVTLSVLPFKVFSTHVAQLAYHKNKEVIIHMPMEPLHKENYGLEENTLLTSMDKSTVLKILNRAFAVVPYAQGISNHMGSRATEDARLMKTVMEYLRSRNYFFLDSLVTPKTVGKEMAKKFGVGFGRRDVFIDNVSDPVYIRSQLAQLAAKARRSGTAIGIGHDRPMTIAVLKEAIPELEKEGYRFVNLSEIIRQGE